MLAARLVGHLLEVQRRRKIERRVRAAALEREERLKRLQQQIGGPASSPSTAGADAPSPSPSGAPGGKRERRDERVEGSLPDLCVICLEAKYSCAFSPCGHMCCCSSCASQLSDCPLCRRRIDHSLRVYRH
eukprot:TRINITY_DN10977_c0_g1_i1.p2 TRINITY_DN10977_c0_g1~~TRINITY_DN10977_c0_g1_i1.p2  ORF type:complete len:131 (-),score=23.13 TRINITY_DN10977_c0_g1_i1:884-1276(-)